MFEPQDKQFLDQIVSCQNQINSLFNQERRRYREVGYGGIEKVRRYSLVEGLGMVHM